MMVLMNNELNTCRVCGLSLSEPPWGSDGKNPTDEFCPCCGVQFGYGDCQQIAARNWRERWVRDGGAWFKPNEKPADWSLELQLKQVPAQFQ
jgi:hypothetical protein